MTSLVLAQIPLFPERATTMADRVDALFVFLTAVTGTVGVAVTFLIIYFTVKYRRRAEGERTPRILGSMRLEVWWSVVPFLIFLVMFAWGASIYTATARPPDDALDVYVVGKQWMWKLQHADGQREINELHVPVNRPVRLTLTSEDVIHDYFVPAFRTHVDVIPGRYVITWFQADRVGTFDVYCSQYCGTNHSGMIGTVTIMEPSDYERWQSGHAEGSLALAGRKLFLKLQCITCHSADSRARAPVLESLYGRQVALRDGRTVLADDAYIRESILYPAAKVVQGFDPIMPTFKGQVGEEELIQLISFIKALGPGHTPARNEEAPPPLGAPTEPATGKPKP